MFGLFACLASLFVWLVCLFGLFDCLAWLGWAWLGLAWLGLAWLGLAWLGWAGLGWAGLGLAGLGWAWESEKPLVLLCVSLAHVSNMYVLSIVRSNTLIKHS